MVMIYKFTMLLMFEHCFNTIAINKQELFKYDHKYKIVYTLPTGSYQATGYSGVECPVLDGYCIGFDLDQIKYCLISQKLPLKRTKVIKYIA